MAKPATSCFKKETTTLHGAELHRHGVGQMGEGFGNVPRAYPLCSGDRDRERDLPMMTTCRANGYGTVHTNKKGGRERRFPSGLPVAPVVQCMQYKPVLVQALLTASLFCERFYFGQKKVKILGQICSYITTSSDNPPTA